MRKLCTVLAVVFLIVLFFGCSTQPEEVDDMTPEMAQEIRQAYFDHRVKEPSKYVSVDDVWVVCIDVYHGAYAIYIGGLSFSPGWGETRVIDGVSFYFTDSKCPKIYKDGEFYGVERAYEEGILTKEDLLDLQQEYNKFGAIPYYYSSEASS